jgi:methylmalonyl-CoA/ethylmalonyl-CoA epimerase
VTALNHIKKQYRYDDDRRGRIVNSIVLPELGHVGLVVSDIDRYTFYLSDILGMDKFETYDFNATTARVRGKEIEGFCLKIGIGRFSNGVKIELIEPIEDGGFFTEHLKCHGNGFNHLAFYVEDLQEWRKYFEKKGFPIVFETTVYDKIRGKRHVFYTKLNGLNYYYEFAKIVR